MGYQAILFCPDEKLARIVSQVFTELDFAVEPVNEPFAAVKKLMAQRYDAIVVDCDNEQNTSLLFKSARNSSSNQNALAIALVEGQTGVAKAYRIGANLVLTKPINVEQAKGTLRVARGLLRKSADSAGTGSAKVAAPPKPAPTAAVRAPQPAARKIEAPRPIPAPLQPSPTSVPEFEPTLNVPVATTKQEEKPVPVVPPLMPPPPPQPPSMAAYNSIDILESADDEVMVSTPKSEIPKSAPAPLPLSIPAKPQGAAAAPAPAKEPPLRAPANEAKLAKPDSDDLLAEPETETLSLGQPSFSSDTGTYSDGPSFAALGVDEGHESGGKKKIFLTVGIVLALLVAIYFGWSWFGSSQHSSPAPQPVTTTPHPQDTAPAPVDVKPMSAPESTPDIQTPNRASVTAQAPLTKKTAGKTDDLSSASSSTHINMGSAPDAAKPQPAPLVVKSAITPGGKMTKQVADDSSSAVPSPLAVATPSDGGIGGIIASGASGSQPVLARISVSQGVSQGLVIKRVQPKYPPSALAARREGAVQIEATVDKDGKVVNPKVLSGDPMLAAAAVDAVRQWRYKPYYLDGQPVEIQTQITVNFKTAN